MIKRKIKLISSTQHSTILRVFVYVFILLVPNYSYTQLGFSFLNLPNNAKINAFGGINVSSFDKDINLIGANPALLDTADFKQIGLSYSPYLAQSHLINFNYSFKKNWAIQTQNLNYGTFEGTDDLGNLTENFSANDFFVGITHARKVENFSFGITAKLIGSFLESYNSSAVVLDLGGIFKHPKKELSIGLVAKNIGFILNNYSTQKASLPFDLQAGITFKPQFMPARFSFTAHHLYQFDIAYQNTQTDYTIDENGNRILKKTPFTDKLFRHLIIGSELLIHKNFKVILSYNHLRKKELIISQFGGGSGFAFGVNLQLQKFDFILSNSRSTKIGTTYFSLNYRIR